MFETIGDVPAAIADFYHIDTRHEPTGEQVEETYEYQDDQGNTLTGTRLVPEYVNVDYVVLNTSPEFKSMSDVWMVVNLHKGSRDDLIRLFLGMVNNKDQWKFHDKYLDWMAKEPSAEDPVYSPVDEFGVPVFDNTMFNAATTQWNSEKPVRPAPLNIDQWFLDNVEALRKAAYPTMEEQMRLQFEDMMNGTTLWRDTMQAVNEQYPLPS